MRFVGWSARGRLSVPAHSQAGQGFAPSPRRHVKFGAVRTPAYADLSEYAFCRWKCGRTPCNAYAMPTRSRARSRADASMPITSNPPTSTATPVHA